MNVNFKEMKKTYIIPVLDAIKVQMIGAICTGSGEGFPGDNPPGTGTDGPNAAPKVI